LLGTSVSDRFKDQLNRQIEGYFETKWGQRMSAVKARAKKKRRIARKNRRDKLLWKKLDDWNKLEDMKENHYLRHCSYGPNGFSFREFLAAHREKRRPLPEIESEEEFRKKLEEDQKHFLFKAPKLVRRKVKERLNYDKESNRRIVAPWLHEVRRRARIKKLVDRREDAIAQLKWRELVAKKKQERLERKQKEGLRKLRHWNSVLGSWHEKNHHLRMMKLGAAAKREGIMAAARDEFLRAINDTAKHWQESPNECRFLRFRFAFGIYFPFTNSPYLK